MSEPAARNAGVLKSGYPHDSAQSHKNQDAREAAKAKYEEANSKYKELESKPNKTRQDRLDADKAKREMEHWKKKADETGENHSRTPKR